MSIIRYLNWKFRDTPKLAIQIIAAGLARILGVAGRATRAGVGRVKQASKNEAQIQLAAIQKALGSIKVESDFKALERELRKTYGTSTKGNNAIDKAISRGMNSGIRPSRTVAKRKISEKRNLLAKRTDAALQTQFSTPDNQVVAIRARGRMIPLTQLKGGASNPKQQSRGVKVSATRGKRTLVQGAFIARGKRGLQVFQRASIGGGAKKVRRLPIQALTVPSIPHTLVIDEVREPTIARFQGAYTNAYEKQLRAAIRRSNARIKA